MNIKVLNRKAHKWAGIITAIPVVVIIVTGMILLLKKDIAWIQPPTQKGSTKELALSFDEILASVRQVKESNIENWSDIDRLDIRPSKGIIKVRANNDFEVQIDSKSAEVLQVAVRRSDFIESIHDGSFFHKSVKLWVFLPVSFFLFVIWLSGVYLFFMPYLRKKQKL